ncbi:MAG: ABC transporter permease [Lachnospiraceae bacterium]|nr:ABC transporter permease [Lachnospiraceae bacterium]
MIVFKTFFKVLKSHSVSLIVYMAISFGIIFILSSFNNGGNAAYSSVSQGIVIKDNDDSELSRGLIDYLSTINDVMSSDDFSEDQITDMMYFTRISNKIEIPAGFGAKFMERVESGEDVLGLTIESTKNASARMGYSVETEMDTYLNLLAGYIKGGFELNEAHKLVSQSLSDKSAVQIVAEVKIEDDKVFTVFQMLPYGILTMLFSAILPVILRFGSALIRKRSGISSEPMIKRQWMLVGAATIVTLLIVIILVAMGSGISGEAFSGRWWLVVCNVVVFSITVVMIIVALSNFNIKPDSVPGVTNVISLSFAFLGGIFVPLEYIGGTAKAIGQFLPTYWYSEAVNEIKNGGGFEEILNCLLIQLLFGAMVMGIGLVAGKYYEKKAA